jgi:small subunit ribosomal protein S8
LASKDIISDGLAIIKNGQRSKKDIISFPTNKTLNSILDLLKTNGYILDYFSDNNKQKNFVKVKLKYDEEGKPVISELSRISKCSRRVYKPANEIPRIANGYAMTIVSTPKGVVSGKQAKELNQGGEVLCYIL